jgi:hypothetical protein
MANGILIQSAVQAKDIDALNRAAVAAVDVQNGSVLNLTGYSTTAGESEVWAAEAPTTGNLSNLWMACSPEVVVTDGKYKGIDVDPRNFVNTAGDVFDVFKPQLGDIVLMSVDAVGGTKSTNTFVVATNAELKLQWAAAAVSGVSLELIEETTMSIGTGAIGSNKVTAYKFEVVAVA